MNELEAALKIALANTFVMYFQSHSYHWNVEGMFFSQFHSFFGDLYAELHGAIDPLAEEVRALGAYAPTSLTEIYHYRSLTEDVTKPQSALEMVSKLLESNVQVTQSLQKAFDLANEYNKQGLADFLAGRLNVHAKHNWMLSSLTK